MVLSKPLNLSESETKTATNNSEQMHQFRKNGEHREVNNDDTDNDQDSSFSSEEEVEDKIRHRGLNREYQNIHSDITVNITRDIIESHKRVKSVIILAVAIHAVRNS